MICWKSIFTLLALGASLPAWGQRETEPSLAAQGRAYENAVVLRWAPTSAEAWAQQLPFGYVVQRYLVEIDGEALVVPDQTGTAHTVSRRPLTDWADWIDSSAYGPIAAQALYGETFALALDDQPTVQFRQRMEEQQLRFSFHLLAADLEPRVAEYSGLWFRDDSVQANHRYLYRIISQVPDSLGGPDTALVYLGPPDAYELSAPPTPQATDQGASVLLSWQAGPLAGEYLGYQVERSRDSLQWERLSEDPLVAFQNESTENGPYQTYTRTDSVGTETQTLFYRLRGLTIFGEQSPASEPVRLETGRRLRMRAEGLVGESPDNLTVDLRWRVLDAQEEACQWVERGPSNQGPFQAVSDTLASTQTGWSDPHPRGVNYYRLAVANELGESWYSPSTLVQLIDSIPPAAPVGLTGAIDTAGYAQLNWQNNREADLRGYRVFRRLYSSEEFAQRTVEPILSPSFTDTLPQGFIVDHVEYRIVAIDDRSNGSEMSASFILDMPDEVPPRAPYLKEAQPTAEGIRLAWVPSVSEDVVRIEILRIAQNERQWQVIQEHSPEDTLAYDALAAPGIAYRYALRAYDEAGNVSEQERFRETRGYRALQKGKPTLYYEVDREGKRIRLGWETPAQGLAEIHIFRAVNEGPLQQRETLPGEENFFADNRLKINDTYTYRILWVYPDGTRSAFSEPVTVTY